MHLQDVLERYSPYETLLEISSGDTLNDTSLAASFPLHTASPTPTSARLDEIQEDEDDEGTEPSKESGTSSRLLSAARYKSSRHLSRRTERTAERLTSGQSPSPSTSAAAVSQRSTPPATPAISPTPTAPIMPEESQTTSLPPQPAEPSSQTTVGEQKPLEVPPKLEDRSSSEAQTSMIETARAGIEATASSNTARLVDDSFQHSESTSKVVDTAVAPSTDSRVAQQSCEEPSRALRSQSLDEDPYDFSKYDSLFKPKVKLGPRPVDSPDKIKRPAVARISAVPANFKPAMRKQEEARAPSSEGQPNMARAATAPSNLGQSGPSPGPPTVPDIPEYTPRPQSRSSIRSAPSHKSTGMTPDKMRLMKAIELRKRQLRRSQEPLARPLEDDVPDVPAFPPAAVEQEAASEADSTPKLVTEVETKREAQPAAESLPLTEAENEPASTDDESHHQSTKADSGIELRYGTPDTQRTEETDEVREVQNSEESADSVAMPTTAIEQAKSVVEEPTIPEESLAEVQADASSTASQTPTEQPTHSEAGSDATATIPTIVMADGSRPLSPEETANKHLSTMWLPDKETPPLEEEQEGEEEIAEVAPKQEILDMAKRRRGVVEPLHAEVNSGNPDDFGSDDDDFLDELHSAEVQEAKPITVARSPMATAFPIRRPSAETVGSARASKPDLSPVATSPEPAVLPTTTNSASRSPVEKLDPATGRARNVSSGISKRIQALTDVSNRDSNGSLQFRPLTPEASPNGFAQLAVGERRPARRTPPTSRPTSYRRLSKNSAVPSPTATTPVTDNAPTWSIQHDPVTNRNSVSVSTRIKRAPMQEFTASTQVEQNGSISESILEVPAASSTGSAPLSPVHSTTSSGPSLQSRGSRFGKRSQASMSGLESFPPPPSSTLGMQAATRDENAAPKEGSKASRFFKRMSSFGPKKKSGPQPSSSSTSLRSISENSNVSTVQRTSKRASVTTQKTDTPPAAVVGDLNVQFPDSLVSEVW